MATSYDILKAKSQAEQDFLARQKKGQQSFVDALRAALTPTNQEAGTLRGEQERLIREQATAPVDERTRLMGAGITDPFERQRRIGASYGATGGRLASVRSLLGSYGQKDENLVQRGVQGYQTSVDEQAAAAKAAQDQADAQAKADEATQKEAAALAKEEREYNRKVKLEQLKAALKPAKTTKTTTPKKPTTTEVKNSLLEDINGYGDNGLVATQGEELVPGSGKKSREDIAKEIYQAYKADGYTLEAIKKMIYAAYP
jgi:hypothetical protein